MYHMTHYHRQSFTVSNTVSKRISEQRMFISQPLLLLWIVNPFSIRLHQGPLLLILQIKVHQVHRGENGPQDGKRQVDTRARLVPRWVRKDPCRQDTTAIGDQERQSNGCRAPEMTRRVISDPTPAMND